MPNPEITVAGVTETDGRFLVEERIDRPASASPSRPRQLSTSARRLLSPRWASGRSRNP